MSDQASREKLFFEKSQCPDCSTEHSLQARLSFCAGSGLRFVFDRVVLKDPRSFRSIEDAGISAYRRLGLGQGLLIPALKEQIVFEVEEICAPCGNWPLNRLTWQVLGKFLGLEFDLAAAEAERGDFSVVAAILKREQLKNQESRFRGFLGGSPASPLLCFREALSGPALRLEFDDLPYPLSDKYIYPQPDAPFFFEVVLLANLTLDGHGVPSLRNISRMDVAVDLVFDESASSKL